MNAKASCAKDFFRLLENLNVGVPHHLLLLLVEQLLLLLRVLEALLPQNLFPAGLLGPPARLVVDGLLAGRDLATLRAAVLVARHLAHLDEAAVQARELFGHAVVLIGKLSFSCQGNHVFYYTYNIFFLSWEMEKYFFLKVS